MALFALLSALNLGGEIPITCQVTSVDTETPLVLPITLEPVPSLKDRPEAFRVMMSVGDTTFRAEAQPMTDTPEDDMLFKAGTDGAARYILGLRQDGAAAMYVAQNGVSVTLTGWCEHHDYWFPYWLTPGDKGD